MELKISNMEVHVLVLSYIPKLHFSLLLVSRIKPILVADIMGKVKYFYSDIQLYFHKTKLIIVNLFIMFFLGYVPIMTHIILGYFLMANGRIRE